MSEQALRKRVATLEKRLASLVPDQREAAPHEPTLASEIKAIEHRIDAMPMEDDILDEPAMSYMDDDFEDEEDLELDEVGFDGEEDLGLELDEVGCGDNAYMDDEFDDEEELPMMASESSAGIEDEITQDYLDDVAELRPGAVELATDSSMRDAAPTGYTARLMKASHRLDRVADYLEKNGRNKLAERIDTIADAIDARIKGGRR